MRKQLTAPDRNFLFCAKHYVCATLQVVTLRPVCCKYEPTMTDQVQASEIDIRVAGREIQV